jgi:hypothetical protein
MMRPDSEEYRPATRWAALVGHWDFDDGNATYEAPGDIGYGLAISDLELWSGSVCADVTLPDPASAGRIVLGHEASSSAYCSLGVGHETFAYYLDGFAGPIGWRALRAEGLNDNLRADTPYSVAVYVEGQRISMEVDGIAVLSADLPAPLVGPQVGAIGWAKGPVRFTNVRANPELPSAFVVMEYGEPYDTLYRQVIHPVGTQKGFAVNRADDVFKPGVILQDITEGLIRAAVIIAEITAENANVFYEVGYAHALGQPTIFLAERGRDLPFDVSGHRCIFYDNTIGGKQEVEASLRKHLDHILTQGFRKR